jgi:hypothetical protein|tara:strand:+ start:6221 stop:7069 length:849 start_codon:yes stop_codon:yes gene_type:complete
MKVTDKEYMLENRLISKLDLMIKRLDRGDDDLVLIDGDEGLGKSNMSVAVCYYIAYKTGREYNVNNIFFDLDELIKFASENEKMIIHWDEAALGGLSLHWWKSNQIKLTQLLMIARKKMHFIVMCIPRFNRLNEFFVVERSIALIHVYARQNIHKGRFFYYTKAKKESLMDDWRRKRVRLYKKWRSFGGVFPKAMEKVFTPEQIMEYDKKKDKAIFDLGQSEAQKDGKQEEIDRGKYDYATHPELTDEQKAKHKGVSDRTIRNWKKLKEKYPNWHTITEEKE